MEVAPRMLYCVAPREGLKMCFLEFRNTLPCALRVKVKDIHPGRSYCTKVVYSGGLIGLTAS